MFHFCALLEIDRRDIQAVVRQGSAVGNGWNLKAQPCCGLLEPRVVSTRSSHSRSRPGHARQVDVREPTITCCCAYGAGPHDCDAHAEERAAGVGGNRRRTQDDYSENRRKRGTRSSAHAGLQDSRTRPFRPGRTLCQQHPEGSNLRPPDADSLETGRPCAVCTHRPDGRAGARSVLVLVLLLQSGNHRWIRECRRVAKGLPFGNVTEQPAHDLAGSRLRQVR